MTGGPNAPIARVAALIVVAVSSSASAQPEATDPPRWFVDVQIHSTFLSALLDEEPLQMSYGVSGRVVRRNSRVGWYLSLDTTWWPSLQLDTDSEEEVFDGAAQGIVALTAGIEHPYFGDRMRFLFDAGLSLMLRDTRLDDRGRVGTLASFRPVGIRVPFGDRRALVIDPLSFTLLLPDLTGIPLLLFQFRTVISVEFGVGGAS